MILRKCGSVAEMSLTFLRGQNLLNTYLVGQVLALQIDQMRSLLIVGQVCANSLGHYQDESAIIHVQPIAPSHELV